MQYDDMKPMAEIVADLMKTLAHPSRLLAL